MFIDVNILNDFQRSHLVFPMLIGAILGILFLTILVRERKSIANSGSYWATKFKRMDKLRFWGTLVLTVIYFLLMVPIGNLWPNTGYGFLFCSIPYVFLMGVLYMHNRMPLQLMVMGFIALIAPTTIWFLFSNIFYLTLP